ncbi:Uncharacterised protein [Serratia fonticola]|uniref:hypothetical protein n=1 Tax=Serratia fonticola TaxID=47917 RepID=UPI00217C90C8|nr:hypothetical protein [Serratia fonticola]CAI1000447.1 Uncharacterised protein [Serratia fonticola]
MSFSLERTNGLMLVVIFLLICVSMMMLVQGATELIMCVVTALIGSLLGMAGRIVYESVTFKGVMLERTICTLLPLLSGWALFVVAKSNIGGLNEMLLVLSTLLAIGVAGACLNKNMPLSANDALCFGIALLVMSVVAMTYRLSIPEYYWHVWMGIIIAMTSLSGVLMKGYIAKRIGGNNAES